MVVTQRLVFCQSVLFCSPPGSGSPYKCLSVPHASSLRFFSNNKTRTLFLHALSFIFSSLSIFPSRLTFPSLYIFLSLFQSVSRTFLLSSRLSFLTASLSLCVHHPLFTLPLCINISPFSLCFSSCMEVRVLLVFLPCSSLCLTRVSVCVFRYLYTPVTSFLLFPCVVVSVVSSHFYCLLSSLYICHSINGNKDRLA